MKLYAINIFYKDETPVHKKASFDLSSFGFFQKSGWGNFVMSFQFKSNTFLHTGWGTKKLP